LSIVEKITINTIDPDNKRSRVKITIYYKFHKTSHNALGEFTQLDNRTDKRVDNNLGSITSKQSYPLLPKSCGDTTGDRLFYIRSNKNMTLAELSAVTGIHYSTISKVERNMKKARFETLKELATVLEVPLWWLGCFEKLPESTLAEKLYKARMYHGMAQNQAADALQCDRKSVHNWEKEICHPVSNAKLDEFISIIST
jgi:transcriptional regulator with XRE-family HTH domain